MPDDARRRTQTISPASWRFTRQKATAPDASVAPYKRRVTGSNPVAPTFFECLSHAIIDAWVRNCAANGCRGAKRHATRAAPARSHLESPESRKKSNRKYGIASYGLTQDDFNLLLKMQGYACGMCRELFAEGQLIHVDHDHGCCPVKNRSCGKCVRGLLCHGCNIALGHIEHRYAMARAYLNGPRPWAALRA